MATLLALDVLIGWVWRNLWGPSWELKDDLLVLGGLALAWSVVGVVFRSRLGLAGGLRLVLWGLVGPTVIVVVIMACGAFFVMAISAMPLFPVPLAICAAVVWGGFLVCWYAAKRIAIALQANRSDPVGHAV